MDKISKFVWIVLLLNVPLFAIVLTLIFTDHLLVAQWIIYADVPVLMLCMYMIGIKMVKRYDDGKYT